MSLTVFGAEFLGIRNFDFSPIDKDSKWGNELVLTLALQQQFEHVKLI